MIKSTLGILGSLGIFTILGACSTDTNESYAVNGDISGYIDDWDKAYIVVKTTSKYDEEGNPSNEDLARTRVENGKVYLAGLVSEPTAVRIALEVDEATKDSVQAVIEPGSEVELVLLSKEAGIVADGTGKHAELVASWMMSEEFHTKLETYVAAMEQWKKEQEEAAAAAKAAAESESAESQDQGTEIAQESEESSEASEVVVASVSEPGVDVEAESVATTESDVVLGCGGIALEEPDVNSNEPSEMPERYRLYDELMDFQNSALDSLVRESADPLDALLAMELGGLSRQQEAVAKLTELATMLDEDVVNSRVTPRRKLVESHLKRVAANEALKPGLMAPEFTIQNIEGEDVSFYNLLEENEVVLLDFWASWCGPCIQTFPDLKEMYASYKDSGFEIVAVSIDSTQEEWEEAVAEHEIPWVNLGEITKTSGPVADSYGVTFIPKAYIVEPDGCIIDKDLRPDGLKNLLAGKFGEMDEESDSAALGVADDVDDEIGS